MEKWLIKGSTNNITDYGDTLEDKILYSIISNRGIKNREELREYLDPSLDKMISPDKFLDMDKAGELIVAEINNNSKIRIVGDYDVDGITSTYMLYHFISKETSNVDYRIPHRIDDGYGINNSMVQDAINDGVSLIITCDNGIAALEPIDLARKNGIKVVVTDHHEPLVADGIETLPNADAIINPKRSDDQYPFKDLSGGAVAYKLIEYVSTILGYDQGEIVRDYLEFAAMSIVCDVMPLIGENRTIVKNGLALLNNTTNIGLKAVMDVQGILDTQIKAYHLGFIIGPMFNASGRLDSATIAIELLLEDNYSKAHEIASKLKELNQERIDITENGLDRAIENIESEKLYEDPVIVVYEPTIHQSVAGIVAGRIKDKYYRPTIVLTEADGVAKGSGRSIEEYNMIEQLQNIKDVFIGFGGHKLAAGMSLNIEDIDLLRDKLIINSNLSQEDLIPKKYIDLGLPIHYVDLDLINDLDRLEPFGVSNPKPKFGAKNIELINIEIIGKNQNTIKMTIREDDTYHTGIKFGGVEELRDTLQKSGYDLDQLINNKGSVKADIIYSPQINEWRGNVNVQLLLESIRMAGG